MDNSATTMNNFDWNQTCVQDAGWFQRDPKSNPLAHYRDSNNTLEWWNKNQISMIWDPITKSYIYNNRNTGLTFEDPDQALFEEELPVLEIDDESIDSRLSKYPNITALYNPNTDHYWYHNSFTRTTHFTLNQALFITQHQNDAWVTTIHTASPSSDQPPLNTSWGDELPSDRIDLPTTSPGFGMMFDSEYQVYPEDISICNNYKSKPTPSTTKHTFESNPKVNQEVGESEGEEEEELPPFQLDLSRLISEVKEEEQQQPLDLNHHALMTEEEDVEQRAERMANEVENILLQGLSGGDDKEQQQNPHTNSAWCGTHIRFSDTDYDPVFDEQYYGREAQKRDWANIDYQDFINS